MNSFFKVFTFDYNKLLHGLQPISLLKLIVQIPPFGTNLLTSTSGNQNCSLCILFLMIGNTTQSQGDKSGKYEQRVINSTFFLDKESMMWYDE